MGGIGGITNLVGTRKKLIETNTIDASLNQQLGFAKIQTPRQEYKLPRLEFDMTTKPNTDKQVYEMLLNSKLISEDKCPKCDYAPILNWFNYCPMCTFEMKRG